MNNCSMTYLRKTRNWFLYHVNCEKKINLSLILVKEISHQCKLQIQVGITILLVNRSFKDKQLIQVWLASSERFSRLSILSCELVKKWLSARLKLNAAFVIAYARQLVSTTTWCKNILSSSIIQPLVLKKTLSFWLSKKHWSKPLR